jgi:hypothetical protein
VSNIILKVVLKVIILSQRLPGGSEENLKKYVFGSEIPTETPEHYAGMLSTTKQCLVNM